MNFLESPESSWSKDLLFISAVLILVVACMVHQAEKVRAETRGRSST